MSSSSSSSRAGAPVTPPYTSPTGEVHTDAPFVYPSGALGRVSANAALADPPPRLNAYRILVEPLHMEAIETSCEGRHPPV